MADKYQKEIEEILEQVNATAPVDQKAGRGPGRSARPAPRTRSGARGSGLPFRITAGRLLLAGVVSLFAALVLRTTDLGVTGILTWIGVGLFIAAYVAFFIRPRRSTERPWRGRSIDDDRPEDGNSLSRFWHWVNRS